ncbi:MAG: hypothetical protein HC773_20420 [Scytonema sp. CRU_2_7]|nr:hypothetical protein [Scytonema sp. CRU_2_7]
MRGNLNFNNLQNNEVIHGHHKSTAIKIVGKAVLSKLSDEKFKADLITNLNKNIDVPFLTEAQEEAAFKAVIATISNYFQVK